jgi:transposase
VEAVVDDRRVGFPALYFRFFPGAIKSPEIVEFLQTLHATIGRKLLIIWDRLRASRSRLVRDHVEQQRAQIALEYLPPYAPDLNPVECIWDYLESHATPNFFAGGPSWESIDGASYVESDQLI